MATNLAVKQQLDQFFQQYQQRRYKKGEILIRAGEHPPGIFYLTSGVVKRYALSLEGEELTLNTFRPVAFFPMAWVLNDTLNNHFYEAVETTEAWLAPKAEFNHFLQTHPEVVLDLLKRIYTGLDGHYSRMEYLMSGNAQKRLITELLIYAKRFGQSQGEKTVVSLKLTERDLAAQTGVARETISRELQKLKTKNLVDFKGNQLTITNLQQLEQELN